MTRESWRRYHPIERWAFLLAIGRVRLSIILNLLVQSKVTGTQLVEKPHCSWWGDLRTRRFHIAFQVGKRRLRIPKAVIQHSTLPDEGGVPGLEAQQEVHHCVPTADVAPLPEDGVQVEEHAEQELAPGY
jgi:hypothetical protein